VPWRTLIVRGLPPHSVGGMPNSKCRENQYGCSQHSRKNGRAVLGSALHGKQPNLFKQRQLRPFFG